VLRARSSTAVPDASFLDDVTGSGNNGATSPTETDRTASEPEGLEAAEILGTVRPSGG
jgi:hypothetical protein